MALEYGVMKCKIYECIVYYGRTEGATSIILEEQWGQEILPRRCDAWSVSSKT